MKKIICIISLLSCLLACSSNKYFNINKKDITSAIIVQTHPPFNEEILSDEKLNDVIKFLNNLNLEEIDNPYADGDIDIIYLYTDKETVYIANYGDYVVINSRAFKLSEFPIKYIYDEFNNK